MLSKHRQKTFHKNRPAGKIRYNRISLDSVCQDLTAGTPFCPAWRAGLPLRYALPAMNFLKAVSKACIPADIFAVSCMVTHPVHCKSFRFRRGIDYIAAGTHTEGIYASVVFQVCRQLVGSRREYCRCFCPILDFTDRTEKNVCVLWRLFVRNQRTAYVWRSA